MTEKSYKLVQFEIEKPWNWSPKKQKRPWTRIPRRKETPFQHSGLRIDMLKIFFQFSTPGLLMESLRGSTMFLPGILMSRRYQIQPKNFAQEPFMIFRISPMGS